MAPPRFRPLSAAFPWAVLALLVAAPLVVAEEPPETYPLFNGNLNLAPIAEPAESKPLRDEATRIAGSTAPGITDPNAKQAALGWNYRIYAGQTIPKGSASWMQPGMVRLVVSPQDTGAGTAVLTQPLGQKQHACLAHDPAEVVITVTSVLRAPVTLRAYIFDPHSALPVWSQSATAPIGGATTLHLPFTPEGPVCMAELLITFNANALAIITLDAIELRSAGLDPEIVI